MMINRHAHLGFTCGIVIAAFMLGPIANGSGPASPAAEPPAKVHVSQLIEQVPIGLLGKPLGSKIVVEGMRAEGVLLDNPLAVAEVDGKPLEEAARLEMPHFGQLKPRTRYVLEGYESGSFAGEPDWHNPQVQQSFQYRPTFVVTRVIEPTTEKH